MSRGRSVFVTCNGLQRPRPIFNVLCSCGRMRLISAIHWPYFTFTNVRDAQKALPPAERAVQLAPDNVLYRYLLGLIHYQLGSIRCRRSMPSNT